MFCHAIRVAAAVRTIDAIVVSSDDARIIELARAEGVRAESRPPALCKDDATNFDVLRHLLATLRREGTDPELLVLLQPTTPFRSPGPLAEMIGRLREDHEASSLVTVAPINRLSGAIEGARWHPGPARGTRMKATEQRYALTGHVFILRPRRTLDMGVLLGEEVLPVSLPADWLDIDVDVPADLMIAQSVADTYFKIPAS